MATVVRLRMLLTALAVLALVVVGCLPEGTGTSSSSGGGVVVDGGDGGEAGPDVPADRAALCQSYGNATASCCAQGAGGTCPASTPAYWNDHCLKSARACTGMPTCFSGRDCNTLIYCGGAC